MSDEEMEKFEISNYDLDNEFNINRPRRKMTKKQQMLGTLFIYIIYIIYLFIQPLYITSVEAYYICYRVLPVEVKNLPVHSLVKTYTNLRH